MRKLRKEVLLKLRQILKTSSTEKVDLSKKTLIPQVDEIIDIVINNLKEESEYPPTTCCFEFLKKETINLYSVHRKKRKNER